MVTLIIQSLLFQMALIYGSQHHICHTPRGGTLKMLLEMQRLESDPAGCSRKQELLTNSVSKWPDETSFYISNQVTTSGLITIP